jgi:tetratricopeptide (TPR) repeat protein
MAWKDDPWLVRAYSRVTSRVVRWWDEVTGPMNWHHVDTPWQAVMRRILLWLPAVVLLFAVLGGTGLFFFTGWRAGDLAKKAVDNAREGNLPVARLQIISAQNLRDSPEVRRAFLYVQSRFDDPALLPRWEELAAQGTLNDEEIGEWARLASQVGTDAQFEQAIAAFVQSDSSSTGGSPEQRREALVASIKASRTAESCTRQARRAFRLNDLAGAVKLFREALALEDSLGLRLELARALGTIGTGDAQAEAAGIIAAAASAPEGKEALAFALASVAAGPATRCAWADQAWQDASNANPALLPASSVMVEDHHWTLDEAVVRLDRVFIGAPLERRVDYAEWLAAHGRPREEITRRITKKDARASARAFRVRAETAAGAEDWQAVMAMLDEGSLLDEPSTWFLRSRAEFALGRESAARTSLRRALQSAIAAKNLPSTLAQADGIGQTALADEVLVAACAEPSEAEYALRVARWRFGQRGEPGRMDEVFRLASQNVAGTPTLRDMRWRRNLLEGQAVSPELTGKALEAEPSNVDFRLTHALALLRGGHTAEARAVLAPLEPVSHQLFAGQNAILAAVLGATGSSGASTALAKSINPRQLTDSEYRLVYTLVPAVGEK